MTDYTVKLSSQSTDYTVKLSSQSTDYTVKLSSQSKKVFKVQQAETIMPANFVDLDYNIQVNNFQM